VWKRRGEVSEVSKVSNVSEELAVGNHFVNAVVKGEKVFLFGNEDELRKKTRYSAGCNKRIRSC
jgi:hypothetical protein